MSFQGRIPTTISTAPTAIALNAGHRKLRLRLSMEVLRHASNGPTAVRSSARVIEIIGIFMVVPLPWPYGTPAGAIGNVSVTRHKVRWRISPT